MSSDHFFVATEPPHGQPPAPAGFSYALNTLCTGRATYVLVPRRALLEIRAEQEALEAAEENGPRASPAVGARSLTSHAAKSTPAGHSGLGGSLGLAQLPTPKRAAPHAVDLTELATKWRKPRGQDWVQVWDPVAVLKAIELHNGATGFADKDTRERDAGVFRKMLADGPWRRCVRPADADEVIRTLQSQAPHMADAIQHLAEHLGLAGASRQPLRIPPLLLVGTPGCGKSHFANDLGCVLGVPLHAFDLTVAQTNSVLHGSDRHWSNTRPGVLWDLVVQGPAANPVLVLEELDKATRRVGSYDPSAPLLAALEPSTARCTRDQSMGIVFDASHVIYMATCNTLVGLPDPLLSRFKLVMCREPDAREALVLAQVIVAKCLASHGGRAVTGVDPGIAIELAGLPPRRIVQLVTTAIARSAQAGRTLVELRDLGAGGTTIRLH